MASVASVSHELRAPLHAIIGLSELLIDRDLASEDRELVEAIQREGTALQAIVDDLLDLSKIDAGQLELVIEPIAPRGLGDEITTMFASHAAQKDLELSLTIDDAVPLAVRTDRHRLRQVIVNLVSNAVKYTTEGSVELSIGAPVDGWLRVLVSDTGPGIPDSAIADIFTPFQQIRAVDQKQGTGLGLSITLRLVQLMAGQLFLCSGPEGSTFSAHIPVEPARRIEDRNDAGVVDHTGAYVLVADDTEVNRLVALSQLERLGHQGVAVNDGAEALDLLRAEHFDAVLMDWHMPGLDGLSAATAYYEHCEQQGLEPTPIIMMTASVSDESRRTCAAAGTADFLPKPVSLDDLDRCLSRWLRTSEPSPSLEARRESDPTTPADTHDETTDDEVVDRAVIDRMVSDLGDASAVVMVIETFIEDAGERRQALETEGDPADAKRAAHTLKSTSALLGATALSTTCREVEAQYSAGQTPDPTTLGTLSQQLDQALEALREVGASLAEQAA